MNSYNPDSQLVTELALINCRELGGMPLSDGKIFKSGLYIRCGSPEWLKGNEIKEVKDYGIKTVGNPYKDDPDVKFYNIPLYNGNPNDTKDATLDYIRTHTLGDYYVIIAEEMGDKLVQIMRILLNCESIAIFHCAHGKDRTGVVAALLYLICGASREDIVLNYKVSYDYLKEFMVPFMAKMPDDLKHCLRSDAHNMETFLDYIDSKWNGDVTNLLTANGLTSEEIDAIRLKCIE